MMPSSGAPRPLDGLRVVELASFISGTFPACLLGDFGADVVKVELPGKGDLQRGLGTFLPDDDERSLWWMQLARNKRSVTLDLRRPEARPVLQALLKDAAVVTENFRPGTLEEWGIGWDWMHEINPALILLRVSGYGQTGPYRDRPSFERVAQAFSGFMHVTGDPATPPQRAGLPVCDYTTGLWGAFGVLLVLCHQLRTGEAQGQVIDLALYESMLPMLADMPSVYQLHGTVEERTGNRSRRVAPGETYLTRDGHWVFITVTGDQVFARMMAAIGHPEMADDERYRTNRKRLANRQPLDAAVSEWVAHRTRDEVLSALEAAAVPVTPVNTMADLYEHPQAEARDNFVEVHDPVLGSFRMTGVVPKLSLTPGEIRHLAPGIGEHTVEILTQELGFTRDQVENLRAKDII